MTKKNRGFTILEVVVVITILAVIASLAIPRYTGMTERTRSAEGIQVLGALLSAQERYHLENGVWSKDVAHLDIVLPAMTNFTNAAAYDTCAAVGDPDSCASVTRLGDGYTISINRSGRISCVDGAKISCADGGF